MDPMEAACEKGQKALSEFQSKQVLKGCGIPVTREMLVQTPDDAVAAAEQVGYPVVLKPCSWKLMHKSELGCIELGLTDAKAVGQAFKRITAKIETPLEGMLVQEMVEEAGNWLWG